MISGSIEYDDRPGPLRETVVHIIGGWTEELLHAIERSEGDRSTCASMSTPANSLSRSTG